MRGRKVSLMKAMLACLAFAGCDDYMNEKADERKREAELREDIARKEEEREQLKTTLQTGLVEKLKAYESEIPSLEKKEAALLEDAHKLSDAIRAAMDRKTAKGNEPKYEMKVLNALKDETVNAFAVKYLKSDFSIVRDAFIEEVRAARADEVRYRRALADADADRAAAEADAERWVEMTKTQRESEIARLKKDIASLESKWNTTRQDVKNLTRHSMQGHIRQERERHEKGMMMENRIRDIEDEIRKKRFQLDSLMHPESAVRVEVNAGREAQLLRNRVDATHRDRLRTIEQNMKPKRAVAVLVQECESKTLSKLRTEISRQTETVAETRKTLQEKVKVLKDMRVSIPSADIHALQRLRERFLAL